MVHRPTATRLVRIPVVVLLLVAGLASSSASPARAAAGGRIQLEPPMRGPDTRDQGVRVVTQTIGTGVFNVWVLDAQSAGTATLHSCGQAPGNEPSLTFSAGELVYAKGAGSDLCLTSSVPVHVVIDRLGSLSATPTASGLQYVPLGTPRVVLDERVVGPQMQNPRQVPLSLGVTPAAAAAGVFLIEVLDPSSAYHGFAAIGMCDSTGTADVTFQNDRAVGLAYAPLASLPTCLRVRGDARFRVTLLGHLSTDGPDDTRLPPMLAAPVTPSPPPGLRAVTPTRLLDTRTGLGFGAARKVSGGETVELEITGAADTTRAVALNVTVTEPEGEGFLTAFPCDQNRPRVSNLNYVAGETVPNLVNVKISVTRRVCLFAQRTTHLVVDLAGTFEAGGGAGAQPVSPQRLLDTRRPIGVPAAAKVQGGSVVTLQVAGTAGVPPSGASAVTMNVTVTEPERAGFVTVYPCDRDRPTASNLNYEAGQTVPNLVSVRLSSAGTVCLFAQQTTHLIADLAAWYAVGEDDGFRELPPERLLDTREPIGVPSAGKVLSGQTVALRVAGRGGVPASGATAVTMNVTVTEAEGEGFVTVYPCDAPRPEASNLNHVAGETVPNLVTVRLAADGTVCLFAQRTVHLLADVAGYFTSQTELRNVPTLR